MSLHWGDLDNRTADFIRILAADSVENAGSGHPGTAISLAPVTHLIFHHLLKHNPKAPKWMARDRFVLSCGHTSLSLYINQYLSGYPVSLEDLKSYRKLYSKTPGHPEYDPDHGTEITTGPLGQGIGNIVGMAMAARYEKSLLPSSNDVFDHYIYGICSDGDIQEGISSEASSLAGHLKLGNIILIYDDNHISIEGDTSKAMSEDVIKRYSAYHWHVQSVNFLREDGSYKEDVEALYKAIENAKTEIDRPSIIALRTVIGWPSPTLSNTGKIHGAAMGQAEVMALKDKLGFSRDKMFEEFEELLEYRRSRLTAQGEEYSKWNDKFEKYKNSIDGKEKDILRFLCGDSDYSSSYKTKVLKKVDEELANDSSDLATRAASGNFINSVADILPYLFGGSADLAGSNNTTIKSAASFLPNEKNGRVLHFGIREHAMGAAINGILAHGKTRVFGGTFLCFSDYMRASIRLAAEMGLPAIYIFTHDSIGLGEDGPTHQPIEHINSLRLMPKLDVVRPADVNETFYCWEKILENIDHPTALLLSRQKLMNLKKYTPKREDVHRGGYILHSTGIKQKCAVISTGSEVSIAIRASELLEKRNIGVRVISMPSWEWFIRQPKSYRDDLIPKDMLKISIEAGTTALWRALLDENTVTIGIDEYGTSGGEKEVYSHFGITEERIVNEIIERL